jgi:protein-S-isoprenylcysteine O-methyltransferase Ste14
MALAAAGQVGELLGLLEPWPVVDVTRRSVPGFMLMLLGCVITVVAQLQMRDSWRVGVDERERTSLVTAGLFSVVRNPIFAGILLLTAGLLCIAPNVVSIAAFASALLGIEIHVRQVEEPYLLRTHGGQYLAYAQAVGRFVPGVGRLS